MPKKMVAYFLTTTKKIIVNEKNRAYIGYSWRVA